MKNLRILSCVVVVSLLALEGCAKRVIITAPRPVSISASELMTLPETGSLDSIAIERDTLPEVTQVELCSNFGMKAMGDLDELSRIAQSTLIDVFSSRHIEIRDSADKRLAISISKAYCESGTWVWQMITVLSVRTGSGLTLEFEGSRRLGNLHQSSWAAELAVKNAVIEMLKSPAINNYLSANEGSEPLGSMRSPEDVDDQVRGGPHARAVDDTRDSRKDLQDDSSYARRLRIVHRGGRRRTDDPELEICGEEAVMSMIVK